MLEEKLKAENAQLRQQLAEYNEETAKHINAAVEEWQHRFGLLPWLPHEVALGVETIGPERIRTMAIGNGQ